MSRDKPSDDSSPERTVSFQSNSSTSPKDSTATPLSLSDSTARSKSSRSSSHSSHKNERLDPPTLRSPFIDVQSCLSDPESDETEAWTVSSQSEVSSSSLSPSASDEKFSPRPIWKLDSERSEENDAQLVTLYLPATLESPNGRRKPKKEDSRYAPRPIWKLDSPSASDHSFQLKTIGKPRRRRRVKIGDRRPKMPTNTPVTQDRHKHPPARPGPTDTLVELTEWFPGFPPDVDESSDKRQLKKGDHKPRKSSPSKPPVTVDEEERFALRRKKAVLNFATHSDSTLVLVVVPSGSDIRISEGDPARETPTKIRTDGRSESKMAMKSTKGSKRSGGKKTKGKKKRKSKKNKRLRSEGSSKTDKVTRDRTPKGRPRSSQKDCKDPPVSPVVGSSRRGSSKCWKRWLEKAREMRREEGAAFQAVASACQISPIGTEETNAAVPLRLIQSAPEVGIPVEEMTKTDPKKSDVAASSGSDTQWVGSVGRDMADGKAKSEEADGGPKKRSSESDSEWKDAET